MTAENINEPSAASSDPGRTDEDQDTDCVFCVCRGRRLVLFGGDGFFDRGTVLPRGAFAALVARGLLVGGERGVAFNGAVTRSLPAAWWICSNSSRSASVSSAWSRSTLGRLASSCAGSACTS